jgi:hypothetical protein
VQQEGGEDLGCCKDCFMPSMVLRHCRCTHVPVGLSRGAAGGVLLVLLHEFYSLMKLAPDAQHADMPANTCKGCQELCRSAA